MKILRNGSRASTRGSGDYFSGPVRVDPLFQAGAPARVVAVGFTFSPGARTSWHVQALGETLVVTAGHGCVQTWGGPMEEIRAGDVVWCPPGEKHWHGASPSEGMTLLAIREQVDGIAVEWLEKVSDDQSPGTRSVPETL